jgi:hypothetical protein
MEGHFHSDQGMLMVRQSLGALDIVLLRPIVIRISHFLRILRLAWRSVLNYLAGNHPIM